ACGSRFRPAFHRSIPHRPRSQSRYENEVGMDALDGCPGCVLRECQKRISGCRGYIAKSEWELKIAVIVGAVCDRALFLESMKYGGHQRPEEIANGFCRE